ncbi:hypothetical protein PENTCL1PPCAC_11494, partial [Pristionchus entomophagus]
MFRAEKLLFPRGRDTGVLDDVRGTGMRLDTVATSLVSASRSSCSSGGFSGLQNFMLILPRSRIVVGEESSPFLPWNLMTSSILGLGVSLQAANSGGRCHVRVRRD